jgi:hypothetical protein
MNVIPLIYLPSKARRRRTMNENILILCTSELLESGLLGEGVLPALRDVWARQLNSNTAIVIPRRARIFALPVEGSSLLIDNTTNCSSSEKRRMNNAVTSFIGTDPCIFGEVSSGVWLSTTPPPLQDDDGRNVVLLTGGGGITIILHADVMLQSNEMYNDNDNDASCQTKPANDNDLKGRLRPLLDKPIMVLDFDFTSHDTIPPITGRSIATTIVPTVDGICHGILFWWELDLWDNDDNDEKKNVSSCYIYSIEPLGYAAAHDTSSSPATTVGDGGNSNASDTEESRWQDNWQQCLFVFGDSNTSQQRVMTRGTPVQITISHDDSTISFVIDTDNSHQQVDIHKEDDDSSRPMQRRKIDYLTNPSSVGGRAYP